MEDKYIETFLKLVQRNEVVAVKEFALNHKIFDINAVVRKKSGDSALQISARLGHLELVRFFVSELNGNTELANRDGKTPLHEAAQFSQREIVKYLLFKGANVNALKKADWTPLMLACTKDDALIVEYLLLAGADSEFQNKDGWNCLHIAAREGYCHILETIINNVNPCRLTRLCIARTKNGRIPLHTAVMHGHRTIAESLLKQSLSPTDAHDSCHTTFLMDACRFGFMDLVDMFITKFNAKVTSTNSLEMNCLHIAAEVGQVSAIESLVRNYGMDVNGVTLAGLTPLHYAARENHVEAVRMLLYLGASMDIRDKIGHTCIDLAERLNKDDVRHVLENEKNKYSRSKNSVTL